MRPSSIDIRPGQPSMVSYTRHDDRQGATCQGRASCCVSLVWLTCQSKAIRWAGQPHGLPAQTHTHPRRTVQLVDGNSSISQEVRMCWAVGLYTRRPDNSEPTRTCQGCVARFSHALQNLLQVTDTQWTGREYENASDHGNGSSRLHRRCAVLGSHGERQVASGRRGDTKCCF
jgi:hypothetical protein